MSYVQLHEDSDQLRVFIPRVKKLPPNPHIARGNESLQRALAPPSETSGGDSERLREPRENKTLRHKLIACDQTSFFTGSACADLQAAHLINAVRLNPVRKKEVEDLLTRQRLYDLSKSRYALDHPINAILLEANFHVQWHLYGTFCFVPSESDAKAMLDTLIALNTEWDELIKYDHLQLRSLDITQPPFANPHWEIVVLHPRALLPNRQPLFIASDRTFYVQGQPPPPSNPTWTTWIAYDDHLRSIMPPHSSLPPFTAENVRATLHQPALSSLAMVINAHYKLDQYMREHGPSASARVRSFAQQMSHLVTAIFYQPPGSTEGLGQIKAMASSGRSRSATVACASLSTGDQHAAQEHHLGASSSALPGESMASYAVEPVGDDGLTDMEFQLVASKAKDPLLDAKERADAAMMMLFGTRRCAIPCMQTPQMFDGFELVEGLVRSTETAEARKGQV